MQRSVVRAHPPLYREGGEGRRIAAPPDPGTAGLLALAVALAVVAVLRVLARLRGRRRADEMVRARGAGDRRDVAVPHVRWHRVHADGDLVVRVLRRSRPVTEGDLAALRPLVPDEDDEEVAQDLPQLRRRGRRREQLLDERQDLRHLRRRELQLREEGLQAPEELLDLRLGRLTLEQRLELRDQALQLRRLDAPLQ